MRLSVPTRRSGTRQPRSVYVFRFVPGTSPLHRLWAGTKLLCVLAIVVTMTLVPSWSSIVLFASLVLVAARVAQVPRTVVPRLPVWFWGSLLIGSLLALAAGHPPTLALGPLHVGFGSLATFWRAITFGLVLLGSSAVVAWTTPLADLAPAVSRIGAPLRRLRVPVDELALTTALCVRCLPLLVEEMRSLLAARRLRPSRREQSIREESTSVGDASFQRASKLRLTVRRLLAEPTDLLTSALASSMRRAGELGEAITARGGVSAGVTSGVGPQCRDAITGLAVAVACFTVLALHYS